MTPAPVTSTATRSETTRRAVEFVAERRDTAERLGRELADSLLDPERFANRARAALASLADPEYLAGQQHVAPGIGPLHGVRWPLLAAIGRGLRRETQHDPAAPQLDAAERLLRERELEAHWLAFGILERTVRTEPERSWQLLRGAAARAADWITVDSLAHPYGRGILGEPLRWAELDQLVFSPSRWERRLVGSTVATIPHLDRRLGRAPDVVGHGLELVGELIGDDAPEVRKSLSWALRTLAQLDPEATSAWINDEADRTARERDGHRAWVIRDSLAKLPPTTAEALRRRLAGIRLRPGEPGTSRAARAREAFVGLGIGLDVHPAERTVIVRT